MTVCVPVPIRRPGRKIVGWNCPIESLESWLRYGRHTRASREVAESGEANKTRDDVRDDATQRRERRKRHTHGGGFVHTETRIRDLRYVYRTMATSAVKVANNCSPMTYVNDIDHTHATLI